LSRIPTTFVPTPQNCHRLYRPESTEAGTPSPLFSRFGVIGFVPFWPRQQRLMECHADSLSELLACIRVILSEIPREILNAVFLDLLKRLQKLIDMNKGHFR
jgi:hypothetical protein